MRATRVFVIVLDGVGVGSAPDAALFSDSGSDTLGNLARRMAEAGKALRLPALQSLGLGNLYPAGLAGIAATDCPAGSCGRLTEVSAGKDTTTGHWEMMGLPQATPAPTFPHGFPAELVQSLTVACSVEWLGNKVASGTAIIQEFGAQHLATGRPILYTSADSVLQIAAHTSVVPLERLYAICRAAREVCVGPYAVYRVIARPFSGSVAAGFTRTPDRRDFSLLPGGDTALDLLVAAGLEVIGVGKISDIFAGQGLTQSFPVHGNREQMAQVSRLCTAAEAWQGLCFANLVDFDMLFGHRNDVPGFAAALEEFDGWLAGFLPLLLPSDMLLVTADHGNDPTTSSTDHSREQVPLILYGPQLAPRRLDLPPGFYHVGATVCAALGVATTLPGQSCV